MFVAGFLRKVLFRLVLEDAIAREENAYRFYESASERVNVVEAQRLLRKLCAEELRHRLKLEDLQRRGQTEELEFSGREEVELLEEQRTWPEVHLQATYADILNLALIKEKQAARYYQIISGRSALRMVQDLFLLLAAEESEHVRWVEKMLAPR